MPRSLGASHSDRLDPAVGAGPRQVRPHRPTGPKNEGDGTNPEQRITVAVSSRAGGKATPWCTATQPSERNPMNKPTTELACRDMVTGLRITVEDSVQKVEMPKNAILTGLYAAIGCDAVDVVRLTDQLDMDRRRRTVQLPSQSARDNTGAPLPARHPTPLPPTLLRHHRDPRDRPGHRGHVEHARCRPTHRRAVDPASQRPAARVSPAVTTTAAAATTSRHPVTLRSQMATERSESPSADPRPCAGASSTVRSGAPWQPTRPHEKDHKDTGLPAVLV